jgi:hypothetical protein
MTWNAILPDMLRTVSIPNLISLELLHMELWLLLVTPILPDWVWTATGLNVTWYRTFVSVSFEHLNSR